MYLCIEVMGMCRRMASEEFSDHCVMKSVKHGGGGIMVWGYALYWNGGKC